jgi:metal-responsive CopG/Arc/MetJ family transcriptional regulator
MYGEPAEDNGKKISRVTVSLSSADLEFVNEIADAKNISNSEVINLLIKPTIQMIRAQETLIKENPLSVAFDLITN